MHLAWTAYTCAQMGRRFDRQECGKPLLTSLLGGNLLSGREWFLRLSCGIIQSARFISDATEMTKCTVLSCCSSPTQIRSFHIPSDKGFTTSPLTHDLYHHFHTYTQNYIAFSIQSHSHFQPNSHITLNEHHQDSHLYLSSPSFLKPSNSSPENVRAVSDWSHLESKHALHSRLLSLRETVSNSGRA